MTLLLSSHDLGIFGFKFLLYEFRVFGLRMYRQGIHVCLCLGLGRCRAELPDVVRIGDGFGV